MANEPFDTTWRINKYRNNYDSTEVWQLKRAFMQKYIKSIPEDELAKLTQVMVNIELLRCTYPIELMNRVEKLAGSVLETFREKRKSRTVQRTFVSAADAAVGYVQRKRNQTTDDGNRRNGYGINFVPEKKARIEGATDPFKGEFGRIILYETDYGRPMEVLQSIANQCKIPLKETRNKTNDQHQTEIQLNGSKVAIGTGETQLMADRAARENAIARLKGIYYTLKLKSQIVSQGVVGKEIPEEMDTGAKQSTSTSNESKKLGASNVGFRLLQSLGWKPGEGIGGKSNAEAIVTPIEITHKVGRSGLGATANESNRLNFKEILESYAATGGFYDLVFDANLTKEDRALIHKIALRLNLKSKSREGGDHRYLVVSRKLDLFNIAAIMLSAGEKDPVLLQKYVLIPPGGKAEAIDDE